MGPGASSPGDRDVTRGQDGGKEQHPKAVCRKESVGPARTRSRGRHGLSADRDFLETAQHNFRATLAPYKPTSTSTGGASPKGKQNNL